MALQLKISAEEQKNSFYLYDCTGRYRFDNLNGWGVPNLDKKQVTNSYIEVTPPNPNKTLPPTFTVDLTGSFPNEENIPIEILPYQIGQANNVLTSGRYKIKWVIEGVDKKGQKVSYSTILDKIFINNVSCCVDKLQKTINKDAHKDPRQQVAIELNNLLESAYYAIETELNEQAVEIIDLLNAQCVCIDC